MDYLERALTDGHAVLALHEPEPRIRYVAVNRTERYSDPEELVRAEFWAELIYRYGYDPQRIGVEVTVPDRTPRDAADLVVFHDDARTRPFAVIECKREGITDSEFEQAVEQAAGNGTWSKFRAPYIGVVAGLTRRFLDFSSRYGVLEREANVIADLPEQYGRPEEFKYRKGGDLDLIAADEAQLSVTLNKAHQSLWAGGRMSPPAAFGELCKLIFVKLKDERAARRKGEPYEFQIKTYESSQRLGERIRHLYAVEQAREPDVFTEGIKVDDSTLRAIVSHFEPLSFDATGIDIKGLAFEKFMDNFFKGDFGQYFTPRPITDFVVEMLQLTSEETVLDPACGSGGFLLSALNYVRKGGSSFYEPDSAQYKLHWREYAAKKLFGIEINDEITRVAKMNMILHEDGHTHIVGADALDRLESFDSRMLKENVFDVVLSNPPFGAQVLLSEHPYLADYELAAQAKGTRRGQKTEVLFLERIWQFLKPGEGRAAVVVPDGILSNASLQYVRDFVLDRFALLAVVSLPPTAFFHFGASVKSSVIFLRKRKEDEVIGPDELTFMAAPESIGYDATGRPAPNLLPDVIAAYRRFVEKPASYLRA